MSSPAARRQSMSFQGRSSTHGKQVGQFQLLEALGEGQYAKVRKALDTISGEMVAVKILDKERMVSLGIQGMVKSEIGIWKKLSHRYIVRLREVLASEQQIFIVLEYAGGGELFDRVVTHGKLEESEAREFFAQLLEALEYLHKLGVVHRDLKPENLLLSATGQLKLADFGFAVLLEGLSKEERCRPVGSPNYMAPELLSGAAAADNYEMELIDIYDAGCILFVMCAGHLPFPEEGEVLFNKIIAGAMAFPRHFSPNLTSLLSHVMDSDWRRRYSLPQIKSHPWMKREETKSPRPESPSPGIAPVPIPVPAPARRAPEILASNGKADKSMTFSDLTMVTVVPKKKEPALSSPRGGDGGVPFINCFEFLANVGIFDLSRMLVKSEHNYYAFSSAAPMEQLMAQMTAIVSEEKKLRVEQHKEKWRIRGETASRDLVLVVQLFAITSSLRLVDFKKLRGSPLEFARIFKASRQKAAERGLVFDEK